MNTEELKIKINEYFDGELSKGNEALLFSRLSDDEEAREYFKECSRIKNVVQESYEELPSELEERILNSVGDLSERTERSFFKRWNYSLVAYAAAAVLLVVSIFFFQKNNETERKFEKTIQQVNDQNKMLILLLNGLPAAEVEHKLENQVVVTSNL